MIIYRAPSKKLRATGLPLHSKLEIFVESLWNRWTGFATPSVTFYLLFVESLDGVCNPVRNVLFTIHLGTIYVYITMYKKIILLALVTLTIGSYLPPLKAPVHTYRIVNTYPHDPNAFTQGLFYHNGFFYESTGLRGHSSLRKVALETGHILQIEHLPKRFFAEGITLWQNKIFQLTWKSQQGFVYQRESFKKLREFRYSTQGWGITHDGQQLIMSDGSNTLYFLDANTFKETARLKVYDNNIPINRLNELEYINGEIWANVWQTNLIARISPKTGLVSSWIDLTGIIDITLLKNRSEAVLNGIAYDSRGKRLFVTGKLWPYLFEIELLPQKNLYKCCKEKPKL